MTTIDEMMHASAEDVLPPMIRWVKKVQRSGEELKVQLLHSLTSLGSSTIKLIIHHQKDGQDQDPRHHEWDDEFNAMLVGLGVRAINLHNESERFALGLRAALRKVERRFGDGFLNSVLLDLIDESDLGKESKIADVRQFVRAVSMDRKSRAYSECREIIASEIGARVVELRDDLKYSADEVKEIMSRAIALYLDQRFSVTRRRNMGLL